MNHCTVILHAPNRKYKKLSRKVAMALNVPQLQIFAVDSMNDCALSTDGNESFITFDPRLLDDLMVKNPAAASMVIAHEYGHYINRDLEKRHLSSVGSIGKLLESWNMENEADRIAGTALNLMGYSLEDSLSVFEYLDFPMTHTHSPKSARRKFLQDGWLEAESERRITRK